MSNDLNLSTDDTPDFREKFRDLLRMQMEAIIFRSKIPQFENGEVDSLFEELESAQTELAKEYQITRVTDTIVPAEKDTLKLLMQRVSTLEKKVNLLLEHLTSIDAKLNLAPKNSNYSG